MNLLNVSILLSLSIFILPILVGIAYITSDKNLLEDSIDISYEEF